MKSDTIIIACNSLRPELELIMKNTNCPYDVEWVDRGLHNFPTKLRERLQSILDDLSPTYTTVLLMFGFCGNSLVGVKSNAHTLVLPLVADCIPIFLGSKAAHKKIGLGTYFFTKGFLDYEGTSMHELEQMKKKYGDKKAIKYAKMTLANYKQLGVIDTGAFEVSPVLEQVSAFAGEMELPVNIFPGDLCIVTQLLAGNWNEDSFLIVKPHGEISFEDSLKVETSSL